MENRQKGLSLSPERWQSGRLRRSWKPLTVKGPGVRIPLSPLSTVRNCSKVCKSLIYTLFYSLKFRKCSLLTANWVSFWWPLFKNQKGVTSARTLANIIVLIIKEVTFFSQKGEVNFQSKWGLSYSNFALCRQKQYLVWFSTSTGLKKRKRGMPRYATHKY